MRKFYICLLLFFKSCIYFTKYSCYDYLFSIKYALTSTFLLNKPFSKIVSITINFCDRLVLNQHNDFNRCFNLLNYDHGFSKNIFGFIFTKNFIGSHCLSSLPINSRRRSIKTLVHFIASLSSRKSRPRRRLLNK